MRVVTVGTGTVVPDPERGSSCYWVEAGPTRIVMDCGAGALPGLARARLPWGRVTHLLISHFHADHIVEIPSLIFALRYGLEIPRAEPLQVWGPPGTRRLFEAWADAFGVWILEPDFPLSLHEIAPGERAELGRLTLRVTSTPHTEESVAIRLEAGDTHLGYTGDTGTEPALATFFRDAGLLIAECSLPDELVGENHLSPSRVGELAAAARVARLAVTHLYPQLRGVDVAGLIRAAGYAGEVVMARDGLELTL